MKISIAVPQSAISNIKTKAMRIAVVIPSRGRPNQLGRAIDSIGDAAQVYVGLERGDPQPHPVAPVLLFPDDTPTTFKWNALADYAVSHGADIVILGADDILFETRGWDEMLRERFVRFSDRILAVGFNDGRSHGAVPHYAVSKEWIAALGYFCPPIFHHWCVDTWTESVGHRIGRFQYAHDIMVRHDTVKLTGVIDETHARIRRGVWHERDKSLFGMSEHYREADAAILRRLTRA